MDDLSRPGFPGRRRSALLVMLNLAVAAVYLVRLGHRIGLGDYRIDLDVYRAGARVLLRGGDLYGPLPRLSDGRELLFTYPPFAALAFIPLALVGYGPANWVLTAATMVSVAATLRCFAVSTTAAAGTRMRRLLPWALPAALLLDPIRSTLTFGQVNALLMVLVTLDCLVERPRWPRGILVGLAAALKLTPGVFLLFFLLRRDRRGAARAGLSFAACTGAGFALAPHDSLRYWTQVAYQPARVGPISYAANQSMLGALARLGLGDPARTWLWLALSLLVVALAITGMRGAIAAGHATRALVLNAVAGLLISPISWSHHWVWAAPALLAYLTAAGPGRWRPPPMAVLATLVFSLGPHWLLPSGDGRELHWSWWQQAVGDSYTLIGLAALTQSAISRLLPRPSVRQGAGQAEGGQVAAVHEARDLRDAWSRTADGEHDQPVRAGDRGDGVAQVAPEGRLAVGPGRDQPELDGRADQGEEVLDRVAPLVHERQRRHRERDVLGQQGDDGLDVAALVSLGEPGDDLPLTRRGGQGQPRTRSRPGT
jgi:alpha-1,2-mannosyltransferase